MRARNILFLGLRVTEQAKDLSFPMSFADSEIKKDSFIFQKTILSGSDTDDSQSSNYGTLNAFETGRTVSDGFVSFFIEKSATEYNPPVSSQTIVIVVKG